MLTVASVIKDGHTDCVRFLLEHGAKVDAENDLALRWAAEGGHLECMRLLVQHGADVHAQNDWAVSKSAEKGHLNCVRLLLDLGVDIHAENDEALREAVRSGAIPVIELYLEYGIDLDLVRKIAEEGPCADTSRSFIDAASLHQTLSEQLRESIAPSPAPLLRNRVSVI